MALASRSGTSSRLSHSEHWLLVTVTLLLLGFLAYAVYDAAVATAAELLQRLVVVSPLLLVIVVHWLSGVGENNGHMTSGHGRGVGFPWGVFLLLLLLLFPWSAAVLLLLVYFFVVTN